MGEAVDTIPSILNKCLFVSPDGRKDGKPKTMSLRFSSKRRVTIKIENVFYGCSSRLLHYFFFLI